MTRRILLATSILALAGCDAVTAGDDAAVAQAIGAIQPALEAQSALLVTMDSCTDCTTLEELGSYLGSALGPASCVDVKPVASVESACTKLNGRRAARVTLNGCELGLGRLVSGTLLVHQAEGSAVRYFETDLALGDHGVVACGQASGAGGVHSLAFDAVAHGATGGDVLLSWNGPAWVDGDEIFRAGTLNAQFTGSDGVGYLVDGEASNIARGAGASLPHAGRISFQGTDGTATLEFGADTPRTGGIHLTRSNGVRETVIVAR